MDKTDWLIVVALLSAFILAFSGVSFFIGRTRSLKKGIGYVSDTDGQNKVFASLVRNGVTLFKPLAHVLLKNSQIEKFLDDVAIQLYLKGYRTNRASICSLLCASFTLALVAGSLLTASVVVGIVISFGILFGLVANVRYRNEARNEALREAVPDALRSMSVCFHAGLSLLQTFQQVASEIDDPLKELFLHAAYGLETGITISEALGSFRSRSDLSELAFISVALDVQHNTGGSLRQVLDAARESVENELELKRSLKVQTAQAKLSARIVSIMPFVLVGVFSILSPGFLDPFFSSLEGLALLGIAIAMQLAGVLTVRHTLQVRSG